MNRLDYIDASDRRFIALNRPDCFSDYFYAFVKGLKKLGEYAVTGNFRKIYYLLYSMVVEPRELAIRKMAIEKFRRRHTEVYEARINVSFMNFGHATGWKGDFVLRDRIAKLREIPVGQLTDDKLNEICKSDALPELAYGSDTILNGNGRVRALIESGHKYYMLRVLVRR